MRGKFTPFIVLFFLFSSVLVHAKQVVRFSPLPVKPKEELIASYLPLLNLLERKLGAKFEIVYIGDYNQLIESFISGGTDLVVFGPLPYHIARKRYPNAHPVVFFREPDGTTSYSCILLTLKSGPKNLRELKGPVATPQRLSTCGPFSLSLLLSKEKKDINKIGYQPFETHREAFEAMLRGDYQAVILKKSVAESYMKGFPLHIIAESPQWPAFLLVANSKTLKKGFIESLRSVLLSLSSEELKGLAEGKYGFAPVKEDELEVIRRYETHIPN